MKDRKMINFKCKFCGESNRIPDADDQTRCRSYSRYQDISKKIQKTKNKIIDINMRRLSSLHSIIGKKIKKIGTKGYYNDVNIITFTDDTWIEIAAEIDPHGGCQCAHAELTHSKEKYNTKEDLKRAGLWEEINGF